MQRRSGEHRIPLWKRSPAPGISRVAMLSKPTSITLGLIEAFQKRDNSERKECMSVPLLPVQRDTLTSLREQLKGIIRTGIADIATLNQHRILPERQRSKPCNNNNNKNHLPLSKDQGSPSNPQDTASRKRQCLCGYQPLNEIREGWRQAQPHLVPQVHCFHLCS